MVHKDGEVMSKSKGNTVAPDDIVGRYGADTLRLYILNVASPEDPLEWSDENIAGVHRFLQRVWRLVDRHAERFAHGIRTPMPAELPPPARALRRKVHQTILKVTDDVEERIKLNTAVSALIELVNEIYRLEPELEAADAPPVLQEALETLVLLLSPFAPHMTEELWMRLGRRFSLVDRPWPAAEPALAKEDEVELAVQVNGKVRGRITVPAESSEDEMKKRALGDPKVEEHTRGKQIVKVVVVPGRLVSVVVK
jgi:leucyl-tRNA synthetase